MDEKFLNRAIELAAESVSAGGGPFGAIVVLDGREIAQGVNGVTRQLDPTAHAEIVAVRKACQALRSFSLPGAIVYSSCEPCPMCLAALYWSRVQSIVYAATRDQAAQAGFDDAMIYQEISLPDAKRSLSTRRLALPNALKPFEQWELKNDRVPY